MEFQASHNGINNKFNGSAAVLDGKGQDKCFLRLRELCGKPWEHVVDWLQECFPSLKGLTLICPTRLRELGCPGSRHDHTIVSSYLKQLLPTETLNCRPKLVNDALHGSVHVHPLGISIMDTLQFQRLRHIKQMASLHYVYPGGMSSRFEHSLGVYHLAGQLASSLRHNQPELQITDVDILCVQIAGLCHDLGHGPFSHLFDNLFMPRISFANDETVDWCHEDSSVAMFDYLVSEETVTTALKEWGMNSGDLQLIKMCIRDRRSLEVPALFKSTKRDDSKVFLLDIVSNGLNGLDVDKWDYLMRDSYHIGIPVNVDFERMTSFLRVNRSENGGTVMCLREKECMLLFSMYEERYRLHCVAYQHEVACGIESMIVKAMMMANDHLTFKGKGGKAYKMSECWKDMEAYRTLTDRVFDMIMYSDQEELAEARKLLERIELRDVYKRVGSVELTETLEHQLGTAGHDVTTPTALENRVKEQINKLHPDLCTSDLDINTSSIHFGMQKQNPLELTRYYTKKEPNAALPFMNHGVNIMVPNSFKKKLIMVYCTRREVLLQVTEAFQSWCKEKGVSPA